MIAPTHSHFVRSLSFRENAHDRRTVEHAFYFLHFSLWHWAQHQLFKISCSSDFVPQVNQWLSKSRVMQILTTPEKLWLFNAMLLGQIRAPTIQWAKDMVDIPGATSSALSFPAAVVDAGSYSCTATNVVAPVMSSPVVIVVFGRIINITKVINSIFYFIYVFQAPRLPWQFQDLMRGMKRVMLWCWHAKPLEEIPHNMCSSGWRAELHCPQKRLRLLVFPH